MSEKTPRERLSVTLQRSEEITKHWEEWVKAPVSQPTLNREPMSVISNPYKKTLPSPSEVKARVTMAYQEDLKRKADPILQRIRDCLEKGPWDTTEGSVHLLLPRQYVKNLDSAVRLLEEEGDWEITILSEGEGTTEIRVSPRSRRRGGIY